MTDGGVPADLFVLLCEAMPPPDTPDDLQQLLDQRVAILAVLTRLRQADPRKIGRLTTEAWQQHLERAYVEELAKASAEYEMPAATVPVFPQVLAQLEDAWQAVRRRALSDSDVAEAIRQIATKGWAW